MASFVSLDVFCHPGGAIAGSLVPICCPRAPFLEPVYHLFWAPFLVLFSFRGQFDVHQFFSASGSKKEPKGFQSGNTSKSRLAVDQEFMYIGLAGPGQVEGRTEGGRADGRADG